MMAKVIIRLGFPRFRWLWISCVVVFIASPQGVLADAEEPSFYYYSSGQKVPLSLSVKVLAVGFKAGVNVQEQAAAIELQDSLQSFSRREELTMPNLTLFPLVEGCLTENAIETVESLNEMGNVRIACPVFHLSYGDLMVTDEFIVKFQRSVSKAEIDAFNRLNDVEIARKAEWTERYLLRVKDPNGMNTLRTANVYYEDPITVFSMPNFVIRSERLLGAVTPDDTYFAQQWSLNNTEQDPPDGTLDADIDAPEGWETSTGNSNIVIAVIDTGVDLSHEDLTNRLVDGYDFVDDDEYPSPGNAISDAHGTACAGLAGAGTDNAKGIAGLDWNCAMMPVRMISNDMTTNQWIADAIEWASDNGAHVLSNSWSWNHSDAMHDAIKEAKANGRGGKGCIITACSHNQGGAVLYPAAYDEVIAVGATNHEDVLWLYSNRGPELDVVGPSGSGGLENAGQGEVAVIMWSTDITGEDGYNHGDESEGDADGDYTKWMGGTSGATPEVAGLAALILSMNPEFTSNQVQYIIESTAYDLGDAGRDNLYGWGRINVDSALSWVADFSLEGQLKHWWKLDEESGTTAPDSVGDANGTLTNMEDADWVSGWIDGALDFDGENEYISLGKLDVLKGRVVTISAWMRAEYQSSSYSPIVTQYNANFAGFDLCLDSSGYPCFFLDDKFAKANQPVSPNTWYHLAGTYDSQQLKIYVDGIFQDSEAVAKEGTYTDAYIARGLIEDTYFNGKIDDVRIYSWAMDVDEILDNMYYGRSKFAVFSESGVRVAWFDDVGNLFLKGNLAQGGGVDRPTTSEDDEFIIQDSNGDLLAVINSESGDMAIYGSVKLNWTAPAPGSDDFIMYDDGSPAAPVAYIDESGDLYLKGQLYAQ